VLKRIMVCDDSPAILTLFDRLLRKEGFEVIPSGSPTTCFDIEQSQVDLVIWGYIRGYRNDELDILSELRQKDRIASTPVIICTTGALHLQSREEIISDKRLVVVSKPFAVAQLLAAVDLLLRDSPDDYFNLKEKVAPAPIEFSSSACFSS
jgi:DNA-binding response OmpR family regulator